ncbi:helix-turn-helix domain-containing protein [Candidatus Woesearchaeota archaeon]|nr:helix-turn-helix domain-containing protein [Candidatus Woesearchaeota archaeon]
MYQEILQKMGLSTNEAKVYEALLTLGVTTANKIALEAKIQRRNVYDTIKRLKEKGLCSEYVEENIRKFKAINPHRLLDMLKEKEDALQQTLPTMIKHYEVISKVEETIVYRGMEAIKNVYWDVIKVGEDYYTIGGRGNWLDPRWEFFLPKFDRERLKKGIKFRHLFYYELKDPQHPRHAITKMLKNSKHRFLPKDFTSSCSIIIYGNRVGSMTWGEEPMVVVTISDVIAEGYKKYFEFMWQNCEKGNA